MSSSRSKARERAEDRLLAITSGASRRSQARSDAPNDVYRQLLSEASDPSRLNNRPVKRRRVGGGSRPQPGARSSSPINVDDDLVRPQTIILSDDSDESDLEWEDTGIGEQSNTAPISDGDDIADISIQVHGNAAQKKTKRKGLTAADRSRIVSVHQAHLLFLLFHAHVRNAWCNTKPVETTLRKVLSARIIKLLHPDPSWVQLRQSDSFLEGLRMAMDVWRAKFKIIASSMYKAKWIHDPEALAELLEKLQKDTEPMKKDDFLNAARILKGSQDVGNQLFCALLRAVGVEARLVTSLQPLPLTSSTQQKAATPQKPKPAKPRIYATFESEPDTASSADEANGNGAHPQGVKRKLGQPNFGAPVGNYGHRPAPQAPKRITKLDYPVFWVEALNPAYQRWVTIDPLVTGQISRPAKLEPPLSYDMNVMSYVIAFEDDGTAMDVTRRYAKSYNAKTRKLRVESVNGGQKWINAAMKPFRRRGGPPDRDQIEEGELSKKEAQEGLPNNIQDFKDHPQYALERHLKRNEIIWPRREVGKINAGKSSSSNLEPIYRRIDVQTVQSADKWYRSGREIKTREQPMKHVPARARRRRSFGDDDDDQEPEATALYAYSQTEPYIPPPVIRGKIPKNVYGNIDIYVPNMVPAGGVHIKHPLAKKAAQLVAVDFADAVTGFQFKGRHGTAVVQGIIVALEYKNAVESIIAGFEDSVRQEEDDIRSAECLRLWRRFLLGLQIAQRIGLTDIYAANAEKTAQLKEELDEAEDEQEDTMEAGGFFPDAGADEVVAPTAHRFDAGAKTKAMQPALGRLNEDFEERRAPVRRKRKMIADDEDDAEMDDNVTESDHSDFAPTDRHATPVATRTPVRRKRKMIADDDEDMDAYDPHAITPNLIGHAADHAEAKEEVDGEAEPRNSLAETPLAIDPVDGMDSNMAEQGGGFMVENDENDDNDVVVPTQAVEDDGGDGFVVSDAEAEKELPLLATDGQQGGFVPAQAEELETSSPLSELDDGDGGGGFIVESEGNANTDPAGAALTATDTGAEDQAGVDSDKEEQGVNGVIDGEEARSSGDDAGSLLSHDPDDEDADPEWLGAD